MLGEEATDKVELTAADRPSFAHSAILLSMGNVASRILGLTREMVIARTFDVRLVGVFTVASQVPTLLYDLLIGGMLSAALVPVLSAYVQQDRREFVRLVNVLLTLFTFLLTILTVALLLWAPQLTWLLAGGFDTTEPELLALTTQLIRLVTPAIWLFSMAGLLTAVLYALQRAGVRIRPTFQWRHPALRKIISLYLPIAAGLVVSLLQVGLDRRLASSISAESIAWMRYATTLQQLPLGLISVAISLAALPRLSQYFATQQEHAYRQTLGRGLRMVLLLIAPAAVGLWLLGEPVTRIIFQHGQSSVRDTEQITQALHIYLIGMLFAAIDFPLNYAFYARNNTILPAIVGIISVGVYIVTAFALLQPLGYRGLVWADTAKQASHALIMMGLLRWRVGSLSAQVGRGVLQISLAALSMALVIFLLLRVTGGGAHTGFGADVGTLFIMGGAGCATYLAVLFGLRLAEIQQLWAVTSQRLGLRQRLVIK